MWSRLHIEDHFPFKVLNPASFMLSLCTDLQRFVAVKLSHIVITYTQKSDHFAK